MDGILDLVRGAADDIDNSRRLPDTVVGVLRKTGINRLLIPKALGGSEAPMVEVIDIMADRCSRRQHGLVCGDGAYPPFVMSSAMQDLRRLIFYHFATLTVDDHGGLPIRREPHDRT